MWSELVLMVVIYDGIDNYYNMDCPECKAKDSILVNRCEIPGCRETDYYPCLKCGYQHNEE